MDSDRSDPVVRKIPLSEALAKLREKMREENSLLPEFRPEIQSEHDRFMVSRAESMRDAAEANPDYELRCVLGEKVFYSPDEKARIPGHIYSPEGEREFTRMSHLCEFHFDQYTQEPEDDD